ncbi:MAG: hypothetical protein EPN91_10635 [Salinibacterium sp.]|nr:MAG: hypothetical protein EPN91_10635 [Salinibacterium sp.]
MGDNLPSPAGKPHLARLASWALTRTERRRFAQAYRDRDALSRRMRDLADEIVNRAELLTLQDHPDLTGRPWSAAQLASFNRWIERLMVTRRDDVRDLTRQHHVLSDYVQDLARCSRFRSAENLAEALMLHLPPFEGAVNER